MTTSSVPTLADFDEVIEAEARQRAATYTSEKANADREKAAAEHERDVRNGSYDLDTCDDDEEEANE